MGSRIDSENGVCCCGSKSGEAEGGGMVKWKERHRTGKIAGK